MVFGGGRGVHRFGEFVSCLGEGVGCGCDRLGVLGFDGFFEVRRGRIDLFAVLRIDLFTVFVEGFFGLV